MIASDERRNHHRPLTEANGQAQGHEPPDSHRSWRGPHAAAPDLRRHPTAHPGRHPARRGRDCRRLGRWPRHPGVSRTTTLLAFDQLLGEGYLAARRGSGTSCRRGAAGRPAGRPGVPGRPAPGSPANVAPGEHSGGGPWPRPAFSAGRRGAFRIGTPAVDLFPLPLWSRLASRRLRSVTASQLDYGDAAGIRPLREAIAEHVQAARGT